MLKAAHIVLAGMCAASLFPAAVTAQDAKPQLISLDYCSDQFALALADPDQILGLSPEADAVHSFLREKAHGLPNFSGSTEEVLLLNPDLVLRAWRGGQRSIDLFQAQGMTVASTQLGSDPETILGNLSYMGQAMKQEEKTDALLQDYRARLQALNNQPANDLRAAYVTTSGFSAGAGTFVDTVIQLAGIRTLSAEVGVKGWASMPLEAFVMDPPDVIIASFFDLEGKPSADWNIVRHPRFAAMMETIPVIIVPGRYLSCNGFFFIDAAEYIRNQAISLGILPSVAMEKQK